MPVMMRPSTCTLVGFGQVGRALYTKLRTMSQDFEVKAVVRSARAYDGNLAPLALSSLPRTDFLFLCIPSSDDGKPELALMQPYLEDGRCVITCAKGAPANYPNYFVQHPSRFGISATVGCMTAMTGFTRNIRAETGRRPLELKAVLNSSLNYLADRMSQCVPRGVALFEAQQQGFTEQGNFDFDAVVRQEINDARKKAAILSHEAFYPHCIALPHLISDVPEADRSLQTAFAAPGSYRFVVQISQRHNPSGMNLPVFSFSKDQYSIQGGFLSLPYLQGLGLFLPGENNKLIVTDSFGRDQSTMALPGAGPDHTATMMIGDARKVMGR